jgi:hypothetical protein
MNDSGVPKHVVYPCLLSEYVPAYHDFARSGRRKLTFGIPLANSTGPDGRLIKVPVDVPGDLSNAASRIVDALALQDFQRSTSDIRALAANIAQAAPFKNDERPSSTQR